jgi:predicted DNA-binding protein
MASQSHATSGDETVASVRLPVDLRDRLRAIAEAEHRTISQELRRIIERHVDAEELRDAA